MKKVTLSITAIMTVSCLATDKPNIIVILADDMSYDSVSALNQNIGKLRTPHIDSIAKSGLIFDDAHSGSAVCTPTRYGLLTGRYCWRTKLKNSVLWSYGDTLIEDHIVTMPAFLKTAGYQTGMVGKWHLGMTWRTADNKDANKDLKITDKMWGSGKERIQACEATIDFSKPIKGPTAYGFDYYFGVDVPNFPPYCWIENDKLLRKPTLLKPKNMFGSAGLMVENWKLEDILPKLAEKSAQFIQQASRKGSPYFLYVPLTSPHTPISPSANFLGKSGISKYADFVMETDWAVGEILKAVKESGKEENTLIIFTADNGTSKVCNFKQLEDHGVNLRSTFKGFKAQIYEGGHRVPFLVKWPKHIKKTNRIAQLISLNDLYASFTKLVGKKLNETQGVDSVNILPLLTGQTDTLKERPPMIHHDYAGRYSVRHNKWKLILPSNNMSKPQLFDLHSDIKESKNIATANPEIVKELTAVLKRYVENGRSTPGAKQPNHDNAIWWNGLPWPKP